MLFHVYLPFFLLIPMHGPAMGHRLPRAGSTPGMQRGGGGGGYEPLEDTLCPCLHRTLHYTSIVLYYLRNAFIPTLEGPKKEFLFLPPTRDSAVESPGLFSEWIIANVSYPLTWLYYILQLYSPCTSLL